MICDADCNKLNVGDSVRVLAAPNTKFEYESYIVRKVLSFDGGNVVLEWEGGSQSWPADSCRLVTGTARRSRRR